MENLTVFEVTDLLCAEGIPGSLLTVLTGMQNTACTVCVHACICVIIIYFHRESY